MKKRLVVLLLFCSVFANAQVWNGSLTFRSQQEIDDFSNFSYTAVNGNVRIEDAIDGVHDIRNLAGLASLINIYGSLTLTNNNILTNTAFLNVKDVKKLEISVNPALTIINGLPLTAVLEGVFITNNAALASITAFSTLEILGGDLAISDNPQLTNLSGFSNLEYTRLLDLERNNALGNLDVFSKLTEARTVRLIQLAALSNINGLRNLRSTQQLYITNNPMLSNFCGLHGLFTDSPPGTVEISGNQVNPTATDISNGGPCSTLPVHFLVFNLKCADNKISLNWVTANEVSNSHFIVQRSSNGTVWTDLGMVSAAGNNGGVTKYTFSDAQPPANAYYRLAQVDLDRKINYSSVIRAVCTVEARYNIRPNPATDRVLVSIRSNNTSSGMLRLADGKGSIIISKNIILLPGQNQVEINISHIPKGIYFLHVIYDDHRDQQRTVLLKN